MRPFIRIPLDLVDGEAITEASFELSLPWRSLSRSRSQEGRGVDHPCGPVPLSTGNFNGSSLQLGRTARMRAIRSSAERP
jgi:hypothetical protein